MEERALITMIVSQLNAKTIAKVHDLIIIAGGLLTIRFLAREVGVSHTTVLAILKEDLAMGKISARCVPWLLTIEQMKVRFSMSRHNLCRFDADLENVCRDLYYEQIKHAGTREACGFSPTEEGQGHYLSEQGDGVIFFWDADRILLIDFLEKGAHHREAPWKDDERFSLPSGQHTCPQLNIGVATVTVGTDCLNTHPCLQTWFPRIITCSHS
ncbi:hypothetical protein ACOMHN_032264 [Nucella lapillus]